MHFQNSTPNCPKITRRPEDARTMPQDWTKLVPPREGHAMLQSMPQDHRNAIQPNKGAQLVAQLAHFSSPKDSLATRRAVIRAQQHGPHEEQASGALVPSASSTRAWHAPAHVDHTFGPLPSPESGASLSQHSISQNGFSHFPRGVLSSHHVFTCNQ
uniref:Uncharacterized protein n=1 Tax=Cannabis sativa TaxID=3483 RepID=A0A803QD04_CANSA